MHRRGFIAGTLAATTALAIGPGAASKAQSNPSRPAALKPGDEVRLIAPAGAIFERVRFDIAAENMQGLGLKPTFAAHVRERHGYLAGTDEERAADIMEAFTDPNVKAIFALTGGWGAARTLPLLDFDAIAKNPKVVIGYSDITALLNAVYARTGMTTFHGPNGTSRWRPAVAAAAQNLLFDGDTPTIKNPVPNFSTLAQHDLRVQTIVPGMAEGELVGGNLTVLTALAGSPYMPDMRGKILFLEDIGEAIYRIDRMLSTLQLIGVLDAISGIVFGGFTRVGNDGDGYGAFALMDIFDHYCKPMGKPAFYGSPFGHIAGNQIMPIGTRARMDAEAGNVQLLEPSVS
ncbi:MAG: LD-carboxypeptidase [Kordiimonadaceae bacterium]|nr:LD-carboxypeptidase [Kordiimonadaceae bacterium]MBO6567773.1 LD-carboxypeptidase [Kordiimonadaceae bacterium]MBO6963012.1 LD-carboxypeptidase [Kordiimonadaceae bacterium]